MEYKVISDAVHDIIWLHPLAMAIMDTPHFQRLRDIKQCGPCTLVYPSATHTRFEHSLGVYHLAGELIEKLILAGTKVSYVDRLCVQLAGLCHDLGHGPYSHTWERFISLTSSGGRKWKHEMYSVEVLKDLIMKNNLEPFLEEYELNDKKINFIYDLILGKSDEYSNDEYFLFEIIANKETGIDVDKWDYMMRDGLMFNISGDFDYKRILSGISTIKCEDNKRRICYRDKLAGPILEIFETRAKMHKKCYQHPVAKRIELMALDALIEADKFYRFSEKHKNIGQFLKLTDYIFRMIMNSTECDSNVKKSQRILERITIRELYPLILKVDFKAISNEQVKIVSQNWVDKMCDVFPHLSSELCTSTIEINFGSKNDPLEKVLFFKKEPKKLRESDDFKSNNLKNIKSSNILSKFYSCDESFKCSEILLCCKTEFNGNEDKESQLSKIRPVAKRIIEELIKTYEFDANAIFFATD